MHSSLSNSCVFLHPASLRTVCVSLHSAEKQWLVFLKHVPCLWLRISGALWTYRYSGKGYKGSRSHRLWGTWGRYADVTLRSRACTSEYLCTKSSVCWCHPCILLPKASGFPVAAYSSLFYTSQIIRATNNKLIWLKPVYIGCFTRFLANIFQVTAEKKGRFSLLVGICAI